MREHGERRERDHKKEFQNVPSPFCIDLNCLRTDAVVLRHICVLMQIIYATVSDNVLLRLSYLVHSIQIYDTGLADDDNGTFTKRRGAEWARKFIG